MPNSDHEAPATLLIELEHAQSEWARANLAVLAALLNIENDAASFWELFQALKAVFAFDRALVLEDSGDGVHCIAAEPAALVGRHWPDTSIRDALTVLAIPARGARETPDGQHLPRSLLGPEESLLCLPIGVSNHPALMVLLRAQGAENFSDSQVAIARQCATVALAALVARKGQQLEGEIERLHALVERDREDPRSGQQDGRLLNEIMNHLPIGLTVQDGDGRFILANAMAADNLAISVEALIGASPADFLSEKEAASRREWEQDLIQHGKTTIVEATAPDQEGDRTWLTSHKPVRILDRTFLVSSSIDITEHKQVERELTKRAELDELTGLPDRNCIQDHVEALIREGDLSRPFALAFIDLDNFKHINDYYGHAVGDALLVKIGQRITGRLRPHDMLARISGDEFLLLLGQFEGEKQIRSIVDGFLRELRRPFQIDAFEVFSSCSVGISIYPEHGPNYETLRRNADSAMYRAKQIGKGRAVLFDPEITQALAARIASEQRLRLAIQDGKFCCAFQPKIDIHTQAVVGFETLVRWRDDGGEIHPPAEFVGLALDLGLMNPITNAVLSEAIGAIDRLDAAFGPDTTISVNLAAKQTSDLEFMQSFVQTLRDSKCADRIIVELTEDALIAKGLLQEQILPMLREIGVRVSIDDFGTGYSSLSVLADIAADEIKIDRSIITAIHERRRNQSILRAIESLGRALKMMIVAEGVETHEELTYLHASTRIRYVQGFYFAKPFYLEDLSNTNNLMGRVREEPRTQPDARRLGALRSAGLARSGG